MAVNKAPTLEEVAKVAGVSRATVSRVVNASPHVKPAVAERVERAIQELNYVPNRAARSLVSRKTYAVALIVPESAAKVFSDPFFATVVQGIMITLAETDYTLNLVIDSNTDSAKIRRYLLGGNVDGAMFVSHHGGHPLNTDPSIGVPLVFGGRPLGEGMEGAYVVDVDNESAGREVTAHLIARGYRRIATIAGPQDMPPGLDRLKGWRQELTQHHLPDDLVEVGDFTERGGQQAMERLLARDPQLDAVFAANDQMAYGAYRALEEAGRTVGQDVAVVGFDDDSRAATARPPLTTMRQPHEHIGVVMTQTLLDILAGKTVEQTTILATELIIRESA